MKLIAWSCYQSSLFTLLKNDLLINLLCIVIIIMYCLCYNNFVLFKYKTHIVQLNNEIGNFPDTSNAMLPHASLPMQTHQATDQLTMQIWTRGIRDRRQSIYSRELRLHSMHRVRKNDLVAPPINSNRTHNLAWGNELSESANKCAFCDTPAPLEERTTHRYSK